MATEPTTDHIRLFLPGPIEVHPDILAEMARPMIGHRQEAYRALHREVRAGLQWLFSTKNDVIISTSSATGCWEAAARNGVRKGILHLLNGNFSERWEETSRLCGKKTGTYALDWGRAHRPEELRRHLASGEYDAVAIVHSETSAGVLDPLADLCAVVNEFPDVLLFVDAVSSATTVPIDVDALGIDVMLVGVQKGFGLPPGLAFYTLSARALERSKGLEGRGYYFNWEVLAKSSKNDETPATPPVSQLFGLRKQLERMKTEGLTARYARHAAMAERVRGWAEERGFGLFAEKPWYTNGLTCVNNGRGIDVSAMTKYLRETRRIAIDGGYGKLKGKTFRIAHMADIRPAEIDEVLAGIDEFLARK
jgi:predicted phosphoserine aminotransferase